MGSVLHVESANDAWQEALRVFHALCKRCGRGLKQCGNVLVMRIHLNSRSFETTSNQVVEMLALLNDLAALSSSVPGWDTFAKADIVWDSLDNGEFFLFCKGGFCILAEIFDSDFAFGAVREFVLW